MKVQVLFFSQLIDLCGTDRAEIELSETENGGASVADLLEILFQRYEALREWDGRILVAADLEYIDRDSRVRDGQEIAIMPPVQGG